MTKDDANFDFEAVMERHYTEIFHYLRKQAADTEDAKDLTQDVFMKAFSKKHTYDSEKASVRTWLYRIAHHTAVNHLRKAENAKRTEGDPQSFVKDAASEDILERLIQDEDVSHIISLMRTCLNKKHFRIMNLYFFSELNVPEIAQTMAIPEKTVYNTINRSIKKIKNELGVTNT